MKTIEEVIELCEKLIQYNDFNACMSDAEEALGDQLLSLHGDPFKLKVKFPTRNLEFYYKDDKFCIEEDLPVPGLSVDAVPLSILNAAIRLFREAKLSFYPKEIAGNAYYIKVSFQEDTQLQKAVDIVISEPNWIYDIWPHNILLIGLRKLNKGCPACGSIKITKQEDSVSDGVIDSSGFIEYTPRQKKQFLLCSRCGKEIKHDE